MFRGLMSGVRGIIATIRGAPSTPLNTRVAETRALRFFVCACFALFLRFNLDCAVALDVGAAFGDARGIRPSSIVSLLHDRARSERVGDCLPFAASFNEDFVACLDLKGLFDCSSSLQFTR